MNPELEKNVSTFLKHASSFGEWLSELQQQKQRGSVIGMREAQVKAGWHLVRAQNALERIYKSYRSSDMRDFPERAVRRLESGFFRMEEKYKRLTTNIY